MSNKNIKINLSTIKIIEKQLQNKEKYRLLVERYLLKSRTQDPKWNSIEIRRSTRWEWQRARNVANK